VIATVPTSNVPRGNAPIRIKTGWTVATGRVLPNVTRCYKCHDIGHMAARCPVVKSSREICGRCGSMDHKMQECSNEPRCTLCVKISKCNVRHVTGSLACPVARERSKECKLGRRAAVIKFGERNRE
jgi:hypothetical protein